MDLSTFYIFFFKIGRTKAYCLYRQSKNVQTTKKVTFSYKKQQRDRITFTSKSSKSAVRQIIARDRHIFV